MARAQGARAQMALAFETTYGTPPVSGYTQMPFASATLGAEQPLLNSELLGYGRDPLAGQGLRGDHRVGPSLPLRRLGHAPRSTHRESIMSFETDSDPPSPASGYARTDLSPPGRGQGMPRAPSIVMRGLDPRIHAVTARRVEGPMEWITGSHAR